MSEFIPLDSVAPVLFITFKRFEITKRVFERIRIAKPPSLYLVSDGPRKQVSDEEKLVQQVRDFLTESVDWDCDVHTLFRTKNWGCDNNIPSAIDWFFTYEESGIILEDDCLPDISFFPFCTELLKRYHDMHDVLMISGNNPVPFFEHYSTATNSSYHLSRHLNTWGWATWRRAWHQYDTDLENLERLHNSHYLHEIFSPKDARWYERFYSSMKKNNQNSTWDSIWSFSFRLNKGLSIFPSTNLVSNIGGNDGVHMKSYDPFLNIPTHSAPSPLMHPDKLNPLSDFERFYRSFISPRTYYKTTVMIIKRNGVIKGIALLMVACFLMVIDKIKKFT